MAYELAPLPYDYAALEPFIDTETMKIQDVYKRQIQSVPARLPICSVRGFWRSHTWEGLYLPRRWPR